MRGPGHHGSEGKNSISIGNVISVEKVVADSENEVEVVDDVRRYL